MHVSKLNKVLFLLLLLPFLLGIATAQDDSGEQPMKPGYVALELDLPKPMFQGTPSNLRSPNLEDLKGKKRPPVPVPKGVELLSLDKPVESSDVFPIIGEVEQVTDGDKEGTEGSYVELGPGQQYVQIDLGQPHEIYAVAVWHFHTHARVYRDVVIQLSNDENFVNDVTTIFNNDHDNSSGFGVGKDMEYIETYEGRVAAADGVKARYVRLYSKGNTTDDMNQYVEVEVFGKKG